jgi:hypothetical protein
LWVLQESAWDKHFVESTGNRLSPDQSLIVPLVIALPWIRIHRFAHLTL